MIKIGHRGAGGFAQENTMPSFLKAIELGIDYIECDVQVTRDGRLVVMHDKLLDRVTNASGYIWEYEYDYLRQNVRVNGTEHIPLLEEVCDLVVGTNVRLLPEIITPGIEERVVRVLLERFDKSRFIIGSFHHEVLPHVKAIGRDIKTLALLEGAPISLYSIIRDSHCDYLGLAFESINERSIAEAGEHGVEVWAWTIDDEREMRRAEALGISGIMSNFPDRIKRI